MQLRVYVGEAMEVGRVTGAGEGGVGEAMEVGGVTGAGEGVQATRAAGKGGCTITLPGSAGWCCRG